jgi:hypothetical protein
MTRVANLEATSDDPPPRTAPTIGCCRACRFAPSDARGVAALQLPQARACANPANASAGGREKLSDRLEWLGCAGDRVANSGTHVAVVRRIRELHGADVCLRSLFFPRTGASGSLRDGDRVANAGTHDVVPSASDAGVGCAET